MVDALYICSSTVGYKGGGACMLTFCIFFCLFFCDATCIYTKFCLPFSIRWRHLLLSSLLTLMKWRLYRYHGWNRTVQEQFAHGHHINQLQDWLMLLQLLNVAQMTGRFSMLILYDVVVSIILLLFRHIHNFSLLATVAHSIVIVPVCV